MKIIVPMAGRGSRFQAVADQNPEYAKPKPLTDVQGQPMVSWALKCLPCIDLPQRPAKTELKVTMQEITFIVLQEHETKYQASNILREIFSSAIHIVIVPEVTRGAAETVLAAKEHINLEDDLLITDSDHFFDGENLYKSIIEKSADVKGIIPVFKPPDNEVKWSYTLFDEEMNAIAVAEKDPILAAKGAYANIGCYYFSKGKTFVQEAEAMITTNELSGVPGKAEFYIAPLYQRLLNKGMRIQAAIIPKMWGLGTPKDLNFFLQNYPFEKAID